MTEPDPKHAIVWVARAVAYVVYAILVIVQIILVQGFLLLLLGANTGNSYVDWAYRSLDRVMAPFRGIFQSVDLSGNSVLDTSVIFAMVMYGILALVVHSLLDWLTYRLQRLEERRLRDEARAAAEAAALQAAAYGVPDPRRCRVAPPTAGPLPTVRRRHQRQLMARRRREFSHRRRHPPTRTRPLGRRRRRATAALRPPIGFGPDAMARLRESGASLHPDLGSLRAEGLTEAVGELPAGPDEVQRAACDLPLAFHPAVLLVVDADHADRLSGPRPIGDGIDEVQPVDRGLGPGDLDPVIGRRVHRMEGHTSVMIAIDGREVHADLVAPVPLAEATEGTDGVLGEDLGQLVDPSGVHQLRVRQLQRAEVVLDEQAANPGNLVVGEFLGHGPDP